MPAILAARQDCGASPLRALILLLLLVASAANAGGVYTWTDEHGVVHYTDRPLGPEQARQVPGMQVGPKTVVASKLTFETLQGTWCEYELVSSPSKNQTMAQRIEWTFKNRDLIYRDLNTGTTLPSQYEFKDQTITTDRASMGNHVIRDYHDDELELGNDAMFVRLRRGSCPSQQTADQPSMPATGPTPHS
jgi:hypothetical protein